MSATLTNERRLRAAQRRWIDATAKADEAGRQRKEVIRECKRDGMTMREIAEIVGVNHQRVSQIVNGD